MTNSSRRVGRGIIRAATTVLAAGAIAGFAGSALAQPFDPAQPDVLLWGSAGFTDLSVLSVPGRCGGMVPGEPTRCPGSCDVICVDSSSATVEIPVSSFEIPNVGKGEGPQGPFILDVTLAVTFEKLDAECDDMPIEHGGGSPHNDEIVYILMSPDGTSVTAVDSDETGLWGNDPYRGTVTFMFNDEYPPLPSGDMPAGGNYAPQNAFAAFQGENPIGVWTLFIEDTVGADALLHKGHELTIVASDGFDTKTSVAKSLPFDDCACDNTKAVVSLLADGSSDPSLRTIDTKTGKTSEVLFWNIGADANGRVFGICEVRTSDGLEKETSATGKAKFSEKAKWEALPSEEKGGFGSYVSYDPSAIAERKLNHSVTVKAKGKEVKVNLKLKDKTVLTDYAGLPLVFSGKLTTQVKDVGKKPIKGKSDVVVQGIIDRRSDFIISDSSITATPDLTKWNGDAMLCTPFNQGLGAKGNGFESDACFGIPPCDAPWLPNGFSTLKFKWYDSSKKKAMGRYKITHNNEFENASYRASSNGYLLTPGFGGELLADGDISFSDLEYRATNHTFRTPAANTSVKTRYNSDILLGPVGGFSD